MSGPRYAERLRKLVPASQILTSTTVTGIGDDLEVALSSAAGSRTVFPRRILLSTGIRETPRSARLISGDRPQNILTTGALQRLVKAGTPLPFSAPVVIGSEPARGSDPAGGNGAEHGAHLVARSHAPAAPPDDELDWPVMPNLTATPPRPYEQPGRSAVVCHCEWVTETEIRAALDAPIAPGTLGGLKRRTRAMMGRCQGFGCMAAVQSVAPKLFQGAAV
jgi:hypothetical protein